MKINLINLVFFILFFESCQERKVHLTKEQYKDIILDLQLAKTVVLNARTSNKDSLRLVLQQRICDIYGFADIPSLQQSLMPLESNPELMLEITKEMNKKLDQLEDSAKASIE